MLLFQPNTGPTSTPSMGWSVPINPIWKVSRHWQQDPLRAGARGSTKVKLILWFSRKFPASSPRLRMIVGPLVLLTVLGNCPHNDYHHLSTYTVAGYAACHCKYRRPVMDNIAVENKSTFRRPFYIIPYSC